MRIRERIGSEDPAEAFEELAEAVDDVGPAPANVRPLRSTLTE